MSPVSLTKRPQHSASEFSAFLASRPLAQAALALIGLAAASPACTPTRPSLEPRQAAPPAEPHQAWEWKHRSQSEGVLRLDRELWHIRRESAGALRGDLWTSTDFVSTDGEAFQCIQGLSYTLRAHYRLRGRIEGTAVELEEREVELTPSPCDNPDRPLKRYRGQWKRGSLSLRWPGGEQRLVPSTQMIAPKSELAPLSGSWTWHTHSALGSQKRGETERWSIQEKDEGRIEAQYRRQVVVTDRQGLACAGPGAHRYEYEDVYTLAGQRQGASLSLQEMSVEAAEHPCLPSGQRILDGGKATLYTDALVIEWRGKKLQILKPDTGT